MSRRLRWVATLSCLACAGALAVATLGARVRQVAQPAPPIVILISLDGWRWDYLERFAPPLLTQLATGGVNAEGLVPIFPSKTFPNHYTLVTGQYPERHGIVSNNMVDPALPGRFTLSNREVQQDTRWWGGEPIWVTAERQGIIAGTMFWPGSDAEIAGDRPTYWRLYEHELPNDIRVDQVLEWLSLPEAKRPTFLTLYFADVDTAGHDHGPLSAENRRAVFALDAAMARLYAGIERLGLLPRTNFVIVSDHGMAELSAERLIVLDDYLDPASVEMIDSTPILGINPRRGTVDELYKTLAGRHPALQVFKRDELPAEYRLRGHPRLPSVIGIADDGWHITTREWMKRTNVKPPGGNHGFDPKYRSMHGVFIGHGPRFRQAAVVPAFANIHVYALLCRLLGVQPAANDGDPDALVHLLR